mgnify:CR=1 FL=1
MHDSRKQFHYSLDSLLRKRNFDISVLTVEEQNAKQVFSEKTKELDALVSRMEELEDEIRRAQSGEALIIPERMNGMRLFLVHHREIVKQKSAELQQAETVYRQIAEQLKKLRQSVKGLEKNKVSKKQQYNVMHERAGFIEMDNLWLARRHLSRT